MFSRNKTVGLIGQALALWVLAGLCGSSLRADTFGGFTYTTNSTSATITAYTGTGGDVVILDTLGGKPVTKINTKVFYYDDGLTSIVVPASVTNIGNFVFAGCNGLLSISVDTNNSAYSSDGGILFNKTKTSLIQCPAELTGYYSVPAGVTNLGYSAFSRCNVASVILSASVNGIGRYAFENCDNLTLIAADTNNANYSSDGGVLFNKAKTVLVQYPPGRAGVYDIPFGTTNIGDYSFNTCRTLTGIIISSNITVIGNFAFNLCSQLTRADFLGTAPNMGSKVFTNCAAGFTVYYLAGKVGFTSPTWNGYPSAVLSGAAILPPGIPTGTEYEAWVLTNAPGWNAVNFTNLSPTDFEKAWLVNARPESDMQAKTEFRVEQFSVGEDQIRVTLGLNIQAQPKTSSVNGWLTIDGRNSMTDNWQTAAGQTADQNKLAFTNGHATVLFDKPASMKFFRPSLQTDVPNTGAVPPVQRVN